jgi:dTDP-4-amino-4,6-dideoxygalactose transaminase
MSFDKIKNFEQELARFTNAPYAILTDCCTHAIELCLRHDQIKTCKFTPRTYLSVPMTMHKLGIHYEYCQTDWQHWLGEYPFLGTRIWDSARRLEPDMYRTGTMQCVSFGHGKPMSLGRCGAIILDDPDAYAMITLMRYDGRDLSISPWQEQKVFPVGYHYKPTIEEAIALSGLLVDYRHSPKKPVYQDYPDCREIEIIG